MSDQSQDPADPESWTRNERGNFEWCLGVPGTADVFAKGESPDVETLKADLIAAARRYARSIREDNFPINSDAELAAAQRLSAGWSNARQCFVAASEVDASARVIHNTNDDTLIQGGIVTRGVTPTADSFMSLALAEQVRLTLEAPHA